VNYGAGQWHSALLLYLSANIAYYFGKASKLARLCIQFGCKFAVRMPLCFQWLHRNKYIEPLALFVHFSREKFMIVRCALTLDVPVYCHTFVSGKSSADFDEILHSVLLKDCQIVMQYDQFLCLL
jgi:hypothetical protein